MNRGIFIAIEGIDGAGKTTQLEHLAAFLRSVGDQVVTSKEPTTGPWGQKIRNSAMSGRMTLADELNAFVEDRKEHVRNVIEPGLAAGKTVLLDRYYYSTIAYQGIRGGNIADLTAMMKASAPEPDAVLVLDVPAELGVLRINKRDGTPNHFEDLDNLQAVRSAFLEIAATNQLSVIDGTPSEEFVRKAILRSLLDGILYRRHCAKHWGCDDPTNCEFRKTDTCRWALMLKSAALA